MTPKNFEKLFNSKKLITPIRINGDIIKLCKSVSNFEAFFIKVESEASSRQSYCDLNIYEYIKLNNGKIIWLSKSGTISQNILVERYAVWFKIVFIKI